MGLAQLLHLHDNQGAIVQSTEDVKDGNAVIGMIDKLRGVDMFNGGD